MSFMFKTLAYDDLTAINRPVVSSLVSDSIVVGNENIIKEIINSLGNSQNAVILIDGYVGSDFKVFSKKLLKALKGKKRKGFNMEYRYLSEEEINKITEKSLPSNYEDDPDLLFGRIYDGKLEDFIDKEKVQNTIDEILNFKGISIVYGIGSTIKEFLDIATKVVYIDISPKSVSVRADRGKIKNIGDKEIRPFDALMRRNYYVDFEVVQNQRSKLLDENKIDFYIDGNKEEEYKLLPLSSLKEMLSTLAKYPFRCKPVYLEGIWGGEFIRKVRNISMYMSNNIAWIFEFIPMEASIVVEIELTDFEVPFSTFMAIQGKEIIGEKPYDKFNGHFPIRFHYNDTYHSNGNLSIQVHPHGDFIREHYNEMGAQDEAYYIIATGHNAKTYVGFKENANIDEFLDLAEKSYKDGSSIDYKKYLNIEESVPGKQFMIPAGTIHSSGRNQLVLESGSLTKASYIYNIYDFNRTDNYGNRRSMHIKNARQVLDYNRRTDWVRKNIAIKPILIGESKDYKEYIVGDTDLMYYQTSRIDLATNGCYKGKNNGQFTVIALVDGEAIEVHSELNPEFKFHQRFLEIIVIPSTIDDYVIVNKGYQPVVIHKTYLKENFEKYIF